MLGGLPAVVLWGFAGVSIRTSHARGTRAPQTPVSLMVGWNHKGSSDNCGAAVPAACTRDACATTSHARGTRTPQHRMHAKRVRYNIACTRDACGTRNHMRHTEPDALYNVEP